MALLITACESGDARARRERLQQRLTPSYSKSTGHLDRLTYDSNENGKPDTWAYMDGQRMLRAEVDENEDGKIDRWEYYAQSSRQSSAGAPASAVALQGNVLVKVESSGNRDGRITRRAHYDSGVLARVEEDTDADGQVDKWETYIGGTLATIALDTRHRGAPDRRLVYRRDGNLERIEVDPDGTGRFQPLISPHEP